MAFTGKHGGRPVGLLVRVFPKLSETFILEEVLGLERMGVPLRIYTLAASGEEMVHADTKKVRSPLHQVAAPDVRNLHQFCKRHMRLFVVSPVNYLLALVSAMSRGFTGLMDFIRAGWLAEQLREDGVQHLHAHFISTPADVARLVSGMTGLPFSISAHAKDIYLSSPATLKPKLDTARFTVTCTEFNRQTLAAISPKATVHRMYHGIDHAQFHPSRRVVAQGMPLILSVGRLRKKKGLDLLIDACAMLRERGVAFRCEIVGYGEEQGRLQAHILERGLAQHVHLIGKLRRDQIIERYARTSVYVQPSRVAADGDRDGIPNVLLEAMAMGLPVVATKVSGIPELVEHVKNGLLVEPEAPRALADAISELMNCPWLCEKLGTAARVTVTENFDNDRNLQLLCQLLTSVQHRSMRIDTAANAIVEVRGNG